MKEHPGNIKIEEYNYNLPEEKIAESPINPRDSSNLLVYKEGNISVDKYSNIANWLPKESLMIFNDTKVIHARIIFHKPTGAKIEIFCLEPFGSIKDYATVMAATGKSVWTCMIGGASKWKEEYLQKKIEVNSSLGILSAKIIEKLSDKYIVEFTWLPENISFSEIMLAAGKVPLPPYIKREAAPEDEERYQTVFAKYDGSVAAPTAGLHFTDNVLEDIKGHNVKIDFITLHVGAGTFKPVSSKLINDHEMHPEWIDVNKSTIEFIKNNNFVIAVGTTSVRTLESLYWLGVKIIFESKEKDISKISTPLISQWEVYEDQFQDCEILITEALDALINWMDVNNKTHLFTQTKILIAPGYKFKIVKALVTNFH
ncbi:MAG: S-adenosylmethionine:tRNA ribosyltransferase-isomerase, partial [Ferruginibacter sp.]